MQLSWTFLPAKRRNSKTPAPVWPGGRFEEGWGVLLSALGADHDADTTFVLDHSICRRDLNPNRHLLGIGNPKVEVVLFLV